MTAYFIQTLRRSTRRPQTQNSLSSGPPAPASPFTKTPLVHHHQQTPAPFNAAAPLPPYGYPYAHTVGPPPVAGPAVPTPPAPLTNPEPAVDSRTELQAQLALLAVQLAELSQEEEPDSIIQHVPPSLPVPTSVPTHEPPPQVPSATSIPDLNPSETENDDDHSDDDDDMEEII